VETKLIALRLLLEAIGVGTDISSKERRMQVQKAVYLLQAGGVKLGYSYGWYINGPYSTALTRDYYDMQGDLANAPERRLNDEVAAIVNQLRGILAVPDGVPLTPARWAELVASVHYLRHDMRKTTQQAQHLLLQQKPNLAPHIGVAEQKLHEYGLL